MRMDYWKWKGERRGWQETHKKRRGMRGNVGKSDWKRRVNPEYGTLTGEPISN